MAYITSITDRNLTDVAFITRIRDDILELGFDNIAESDRLFWFNGNSTIFASDGSVFGVTDILHCIGGDIKGAYNYADLNRVENNCRYLADLLTSLGYSCDIVTKTDWVEADIPYLVEQINRVRGNVIRVAQALIASGLTPTITLGNVLNYQDANDLEISLDFIKNVIENIQESWLYSGMEVSGG